MANYSELTTLINAYIKQNGVQAITGQVLNGILLQMVSQLGEGYNIVGTATPSTDPGTPDAPCAYIASEPGTYSHFGSGFTVDAGEIALLKFDSAWSKDTLAQGIASVGATVDANVGTPACSVSFVDGVLTFDFSNMKGEPGTDGTDGAAAGFGTIDATVDANIGTPGVTVQTSGDNTAKNITFQFTNLKGAKGDTGETGVTSVVATVDNTVGTPSCTVSLNAGVLTLAFSGLKGLKGDTGVSADYPITIYNGLDSTATDQALSAYQGKVLDDKVSQLSQEVDEKIDGEYTFTFTAASSEHGSKADLFPIDVKAGESIKITLTQGTGVCNGQDIKFYLYRANQTEITHINGQVIGTEAEIIAPDNAAYIGIYMYQVSTYGSFIVTAKYGGILADLTQLHGEFSSLQSEVSNDATGKIKYTFVSAVGEHSSTADKHPISYKAGTNLRGKINTGTASFNGSSLMVYLYNGNTPVKNKTIAINTEFEICAASDADSIAFYIYRVTVAGTFIVDLYYGGLESLKDELSWLPDLNIPDYFKEVLPTKVSAIRSAMLGAGKNGSTFIFITDVHWSNNAKNSPALINYLMQKLPLSDVFYGGDTINGGEVETMVGLISDFGTKMHEVSKRFFAICGNHDDNLADGGTGFDGDYFYTLLLKYADYQVIPGEYDNYYFDNETSKTRYIILNTGHTGDYQTAAQSSWLSTILDSMPSGFHAVILLHIAYYDSADLASDTMSGTMAAAVSVADSFNSLNDGRKVEAFFAGHLHDDANKTTPGGIPIILTDCDARQTSSGQPQTLGTINEQAFDVITVDYSGTVTCVRIGRGNDRIISY